MSTLVFAERTGLANLYEMVRYCHDATYVRPTRSARPVWFACSCAPECEGRVRSAGRRTCRRLLLARHFQDTSVSTPCRTACGTCTAADTAAPPIDVTAGVLVLLLALQQAECVYAFVWVADTG